MSPRALAVRWTCERFADCKFWTFTFPTCTTYEAGSVIWDRLRRRIIREWPECRLLRVYEMHPGGHGLHIHAVTPDWLSVRRMISMAKAVGFGRIHVVQWDTKKGLQAGEYLAKYLTKLKRPDSMKHKRLYATIGIPPEQKTFQKDILFRSVNSEIWSILRHHPEWERLRFAERVAMARRVFVSYVSADRGSPPDGPAAAGGWQRRGLYLVIIGTIRHGRETVRAAIGLERELRADLKKKLDISTAALHKSRAGEFFLRHEPTIEQEIDNHEYETNTDNVHAARASGILCPF